MCFLSKYNPFPLPLLPPSTPPPPFKKLRLQCLLKSDQVETFISDWSLCLSLKDPEFRYYYSNFSVITLIFCNISNQLFLFSCLLLFSPKLKGDIGEEMWSDICDIWDCTVQLRDRERITFNELLKKKGFSWS